jgi:hypothetical protein
MKERKMHTAVITNDQPGPRDLTTEEISLVSGGFFNTIAPEPVFGPGLSFPLFPARAPIIAEPRPFKVLPASLFHGHSFNRGREY